MRILFLILMLSSVIMAGEVSTEEIVDYLIHVGILVFILILWVKVVRRFTYNRDE